MSSEEHESFLSQSTPSDQTRNVQAPTNHPFSDTDKKVFSNWKLCSVLTCIIVAIVLWLSLRNNNPSYDNDVDYTSMFPMHPMLMQPPTNLDKTHRIKEFDHAQDESVSNLLNQRTFKNILYDKTAQTQKIKDEKENIEPNKEEDTSRINVVEINNDNHVNEVNNHKQVNIEPNKEDEERINTVDSNNKHVQNNDDIDDNNVNIVQKQVNKENVINIAPKPTLSNNTESEIQNKPNNNALFFEWKPLDIDGDKHHGINILQTDITSLIINETVSDKELHSNFFGPHSFHIKYPQTESHTYAVNEIRKYCFYFKLNENKHDIHAAQIDLIFKKFKLEPGFDRIIIRHFNESFVDPPIAFAGKVHDFDVNKYPNASQDLLNAMQQTYYLYPAESKTICIEFQSDDSIVDEGFDFNVNIKYDMCQWTQWLPCTTLNLVGVKWSRGPMSNGKCGVGITKKSRYMSNMTHDVPQKPNGYIDCATDIGENGPEFCIKAPCSDYDLTKDEDFPPHPEPGWMWYNGSRYYNGVGRYDPIYPDPFRLYLSQNKHKPFADISKAIDDLLHNLEQKMLNISNDHYHPNVLRFGIQDAKHKEQTAEFLGARVLDSLLIGRPFILDATGDSVTSGHDNMQESTYAMQTQSRLREFFVNNGVKGSAFQVRNIAEGGGVSTNTQGFMPIAMSTENYDYFSPLYKRIQDEIIYERENVYKDKNEHRFITAGFPTRNIDVLLWEYHFTDHRATNADRELHLREGALLNAIWGAVNPIGGIRVSESCQNWEDLEQKMETWSAKKGYTEIAPYYADHNALGTVFVEPDYGMHGACDILLNGSIVTDKRYGDNGQRAPGQMYGYTSYWLKANWHPNTRGHRVIADILSYWILESGHTFIQKHKNEMILLNGYNELYHYLRQKSGDWSSKVLNSITSQDTTNTFIKPLFCREGSGKCASVPFALTAYKPQTFNTHFKLRDYVMNKVPWNRIERDLGWKLWNSDNIISMEQKTGSPGNMDMKYHFMYNADFYLNAYKTYVRNAKDVENDNMQQKPSKDIMDNFEKYLIANELFLQIKVLVPKYGNGTVEIFHQFGCDVKGKVYDLIGSQEYVHKYIAPINEVEGIGTKMANITVSQCTFQGLKAGTKYKLSIVPYNIWNHGTSRDNNWQFGFVFAY